MKSLFMSKITPLLAAPVLLLSFAFFADHANFSGDWKLNEGKSDLGNFGRFAATGIKVTQTDADITIAKTAPSFGGGDPTTTTETLSFDGKASESTVFGNSKKTSTAKWSDDGKSLAISYTIAFERNGQTSELKGTETWSLTADGALSVVTVSSSQRGETTTKAIYTK